MATKISQKRTKKKPETHCIREIVPREEISDDSKVNQEEQCETKTPSIEEIVPQGEIHDDSTERGEEQCLSAKDTKFTKVSSGTPQRISQVEENENQGQTNARQNSNDTTHKSFKIMF